MPRHYGRGPKGYRRSDERIKEDVSDCLFADPFLDASDIEVHVERGQVTLEGNVDSRWSKQRAGEIIDQIVGVEDVLNHLRIDQELVRPEWSGNGRSTQQTRA